MMEHTEALKVEVERKFPETLIAIHPNDGMDLNLFTREHALVLYAGTSLEKLKAGSGLVGEGELHLLNDCPVGTLQVSEAIASRLCYSDTAVLILEEKKLFMAYK